MSKAIECSPYLAKKVVDGIVATGTSGGNDSQPVITVIRFAGFGQHLFLHKLHLLKGHVALRLVPTRHSLPVFDVGRVAGFR